MSRPQQKKRVTAATRDISVRLDEADYKELHLLSKANQRSISGTIRMLVAQHLEAQRRPEKKEVRP